MSILQNLSQYLPFLIPAILIEMGLLAAALISILRHRTYRTGNRVLWIVIVIVLNIIGPILYFAIGRGDE